MVAGAPDLSLHVQGRPASYRGGTLIVEGMSIRCGCDYV